MPDMFVSNARRRRRPGWRVIAAIVVVLLLAGGGVAYYLFTKKQDDYSNPNAEFTQPTKPPKPKPKPETFKWPIYGFTPDRSRFLDAKLGTPARKLWTFSKGSGLIEFQPV